MSCYVDRQRFGAELTRLIIESGMSRNEFARRLDPEARTLKHRRSVLRWLGWYNLPSPDMLERIAEILDVPVEQLKEAA